MKNQKIAIPTADGQLWPHFGKAPQVTFVTVEDGNSMNRHGSRNGGKL